MGKRYVNLRDLGRGELVDGLKRGKRKVDGEKKEEDRLGSWGER